MCFSLVAVSLCGAQGTQRYKAAENSALGVWQVVVKRDRDTPGQIRGFLQKAADRQKMILLVFLILKPTVYIRRRKKKRILIKEK